jgi:hypothetical protein
MFRASSGWTLGVQPAFDFSVYSMTAASARPRRTCDELRFLGAEARIWVCGFRFGVVRCLDGSPLGPNDHGMITILPNESLDSIRR